MSTKLTMNRVSAERLGKRAEIYAASFLLFKGYRLLAIRFKTGLGEVDLIAAKGDLISFIEVKARRTLAEAVDAVSLESQQRISNAADIWISRQPNSSHLSIRFDIIAICPWRWPKHLKDAF